MSFSENCFYILSSDWLDIFIVKVVFHCRCSIGSEVGIIRAFDDKLIKPSKAE